VRRTPRRRTSSLCNPFLSLIRHFIDQDKPLQIVCRMQSGIEFRKTTEINCSAERAKVCAAILH
jgi:hypothetical protein